MTKLGNGNGVVFVSHSSCATYYKILSHENPLVPMEYMGVRLPRI